MKHWGFLALLLSVALPASAQQVSVTPPTAEEQRRPTLELGTLLYGDNTEFIGDPYRDGETLLGGQLSLAVRLHVGGNARLRLGGWTDSRWGSDKAFESARPLISLEVGNYKDRFIMGTLPVGANDFRERGAGWPDVAGPHGLVPPLQRDTLSLERGYEAGLQWQHDGLSWQQDSWISWQKLNTPEHRERLDAGASARVLLGSDHVGDYALLGQAHVVHEGGQLYHAGSVGDSLAAGIGGQIIFNLQAFGSLTVEDFLFVSKHNPDRADRARADRLDGLGFFARTAWECEGIRAAWLYWGARDWAKWEGDPNYGSLTNDGPVVSARRYQEFSLSRRFPMGEFSDLVASGRLHRIDGTWDYSYRVVARIRLDYPLGNKEK